MSEQFNFKVLTVDGEVLIRKLAFIKCFTDTGEIGVFPDHTPSIMILGDTDIYLEESEENNDRIYVSNGFLSIDRDTVTCIVDEYLTKDDIDFKLEETLLKESKEIYNSSDSYKKQVARDQRIRSEAKLRLIES